MKRSLICFCFLMILDRPGYTQPAKAAPAFYIVLNTLTKACTVVDRLPRTDTPNITVASDAIYKTRAEAETAVDSEPPGVLNQHASTLSHAPHKQVTAVKSSAEIVARIHL